MHTGARSAEGPTILRLLEFIRESGTSSVAAKIYLSDPSRAVPEKAQGHPQPAGAAGGAGRDAGQEPRETGARRTSPVRRQAPTAKAMVAAITAK